MSNRTASTVFGIELYNEIQRLLCEWHGADAGEQTAMMPRLVETIVRLTRTNNTDVAQLACHDGADST